MWLLSGPTTSLSQKKINSNQKKYRRIRKRRARGGEEVREKEEMVSMYVAWRGVPLFHSGCPASLHRK